MGSTVAFAEDSTVNTANGQLSGNIGVVSKYIYRGGVENDDLTIQGGLEYAHKSGISVGYWGSTLDYDMTDESHKRGFEHDFYVAYSKEINSDWKVKLQSTAYYYQDGGTVHADNGDHRKTLAYDLLTAVSYKDLSLSATVMLSDAVYANAGDTYLSAAYSYALPKDFALNASVGGTAYNSSGDDALMLTTQDFSFNEARLGLSKSFENTGLNASVDYVFGGEDRVGESFDDHVVVALNYSF